MIGYDVYLLERVFGLTAVIDVVINHEAESE